MIINTTDKWRFKSVKKFPDVPIGKLLLLTESGTAVVGEYKKDGGFTAWSELPKKPIDDDII